MPKTRNFGVVSENEQKDGIAGAENTAEVDGASAGETPESAGAAQTETTVPPVLVYIGPSIFRTELINGRAFITHGKTMDEIIPDELRNYPLARMMFVTPAELSAAKARIHDPGTAMGNAYKRLSGN